MTNPIKDTLVRLEEMLHLQSFTSLADSESKDVTLAIETNMTMTTSMMICDIDDDDDGDEERRKMNHSSKS